MTWPHYLKYNPRVHLSKSLFLAFSLAASVASFISCLIFQHEAKASKPNSKDMAELLLTGRQFANRQNTASDDSVSRMPSKNAVTLKPGSWEYHLEMGKSLVSAGKDNEALLELFQSLRLNGKNPDARSEIGMILLKRGNWDEAGGQFKQVLDLNCKDLTARGNLAVCLTQLGLIDHAIEQFRIIIDADPTNIRAFYNLAAALERRGQFKQACNFYIRMIGITQRNNTSESEAYLALGYAALGKCMIQLKDFKSAITLEQKSIQLAPDNHLAYLALGDALIQTGNKAEALDAYRKAVQLNPKDPSCKMALSYLLKNNIGSNALTR